MILTLIQLWKNYTLRGPHEPITVYWLGVGIPGHGAISWQRTSFWGLRLMTFADQFPFYSSKHILGWLITGLYYNNVGYVLAQVESPHILFTKY